MARRFENQLVPESLSQAIGGQKAMVNVAYGGQNGHSMDYDHWVNNSSYVSRNIFVKLMEFPRFLDFTVEPRRLKAMLKAFFETHPTSVEGLNKTLTAEFLEHSASGAGEMQETVSNMTRARSVPVFNVPDKYGRPLQTLIEYWMEKGMMDPDTKVPGIFYDNPTLSEAEIDFLPDFQSATCMFIKPDPTFRYVDDAWLITNMMPKTGGDHIGKRDLTAAGEGLDLSIEFTGLQQVGAGVKATAQEMLSAMRLTNANPNVRNAHVTAVHADIAAIDDVGYQEMIDAAAANSTADGTDGGGAGAATGGA